MQLSFFSHFNWLLFSLFSALFVYLSWRPLQNTKVHGFYRFFVFEGILILVLMNFPFWFIDPFKPTQLISWLLLFLSVLFILQGSYLLTRLGASNSTTSSQKNAKQLPEYADNTNFTSKVKNIDRTTSPENYNFENTENLVTQGIYNYIRHPMYSSLLLLAWGAFFKHISIYSLVIVLFTTVFILITAFIEEKENISYFGRNYKNYMRKTKRLIPYIY